MAFFGVILALATVVIMWALPRWPVPSFCAAIALQAPWVVYDLAYHQWWWLVITVAALPLYGREVWVRARDGKRRWLVSDPCPACGAADLAARGGKHVCPACQFIQPCCNP